MAATTGSEDMKESSSPEKTLKSQNIVPKTPDKLEDVSSNGMVSSSSSSADRRPKNLLRPTVFSSSASQVSLCGSIISLGRSPTKATFSLRPSTFSSAPKPDSSNSAIKRPVLLRASQLESIANSPVSTTTDNITSSFPTKFNNPFFKIVGNDNKGEDTCSSTVSNTEDKISSFNEEKSNPPNSVTEKLSFVPLASTNSASSSLGPPAVSTTAPTFVFGQNLHERVGVPVETTPGEPEANETKDEGNSATECDGAKTNGATPAMLFSSVIQQELSDKHDESVNEERKRKSLSEAAREYEESRASKRKYDEVTVKTGEEEEINILQINCKLFAFNKEKSTWVERGRGTLRLNDLSQDNRTQSRVVMRVSGSLRLVLNTKIWAEMTVDRPSEKSVRLTAMDSSGEIKVFLVMAGVKEIDQLFKALEWRVANQRKIASACDKSLQANKC